jgi:alkanesulfonate monooxygenase SsuD/methylene tetrahydromethanopterin reductase-like flavin-dependent oxidoreductase (luciferase family)
MLHELRFSILTPPNVPWPEFLRRCHHVEDLGFDGLCFADHFTQFLGQKGPWFELWTQLSAIAMATSRIRLATLVAQIPFRNPALFALQALTADHISCGRLDVGLGTGLDIDPSYRMMGIENWTAKERVARFGEYIEIVSLLLTEPEVSYQGRHYRIDGAALNPRPLQAPRPPLIVAALGSVMLGHAARYADVWNTMSFASSFEAQCVELEARVAVFDARCRKIGRDPTKVRRSVLMYSASGAIPHFESEEAFVDKARRIISLGFTDLVFYYPRPEDRPMFERIARDVIPSLKVMRTR